MAFTTNKQNSQDDIAGDFLFPAVALDDADVVADCRVRIEFYDNQACDAIVAVYRNRIGDRPVGEPIADLSFFLSRFPNPNEVSFQVSGVAEFSVLVRRTGTPGVLKRATFDYQLGTLTNRGGIAA